MSPWGTVQPGLAPAPLNPALPSLTVSWLFPPSAMLAQPAERSCAESVQPFLGSILEELMGPVSSGFSELRSLFEKEVDELSQSFQTTKDSAQLKEVGYESKEWVGMLCLFVGLCLHSFILFSLPLSLSPVFSSALPSIHLPFHLFIWSFWPSFIHIIHSSIHPSIYLISFTNGFHVTKIITCLYKLNSIQRYLHKSKINHHRSYPPNSSPPPTPKVSPLPTP